MTQRIHDVLDGELPAERLTPHEAAELDEMEEAVRGALSGIQSEQVPDVATTVMARVRAMPPHAVGRPGAVAGLRDALHAFWLPRTFQFTLRPAWALAAAAALALLAVRPVRVDGPALTGPLAVAPAPATGAGIASAPTVFVQFRLQAPGARQVQLAGDFTGWQPQHSLHQAVDGIWTITLPVSAGVHEYGFVVDGERWVTDPLAPPVDDGFGGQNSRLDVLAGAGLGL